MSITERGLPNKIPHEWWFNRNAFPSSAEGGHRHHGVGMAGLFGDFFSSFVDSHLLPGPYMVIPLCEHGFLDVSSYIPWR